MRMATCLSNLRGTLNAAVGADGYINSPMQQSPYVPGYFLIGALCIAEVMTSAGYYLVCHVRLGADAVATMLRADAHCSFHTPAMDMLAYGRDFLLAILTSQDGHS